MVMGMPVRRGRRIDGHAADRVECLFSAWHRAMFHPGGTVVTCVAVFRHD
jgi:hypothetical protein